MIFILRSQCGRRQGGSDIFLTGLGVIDGRITASNDCKGNAAKWLGGIIGKPITTSETYAPFVGLDRRIHGRGSVYVWHKVNCTARVQISLETRVCNRFGHNCNARTIADTTNDGLPDRGLHLRELTGDCRTGRDDYRVKVHIQFTLFEGLDSQGAAVAPVLTRTDDESVGKWTALTC